MYLKDFGSLFLLDLTIFYFFLLSSTFFLIFFLLHFPLNFLVTIHSLMARGGGGGVGCLRLKSHIHRFHHHKFTVGHI